MYLHLLYNVHSGIYTLLFAYLPEEVPTEEEVESPQSLDFSVLECLLFALNKTGSQVDFTSHFFLLYL